MSSDVPDAWEQEEAELQQKFLMDRLHSVIHGTNLPVSRNTSTRYRPVSQRSVSDDIYDSEPVAEDAGWRDLIVEHHQRSMFGGEEDTEHRLADINRNHYGNWGFGRIGSEQVNLEKLREEQTEEVDSARVKDMLEQFGIGEEQEEEMSSVDTGRSNLQDQDTQEWLHKNDQQVDQLARSMNIVLPRQKTEIGSHKVKSKISISNNVDKSKEVRSPIKKVGAMKQVSQKHIEFPMKEPEIVQADPKSELRGAMVRQNIVSIAAKTESSKRKEQGKGMLVLSGSELELDPLYRKLQSREEQLKDNKEPPARNRFTAKPSSGVPRGKTQNRFSTPIQENELKSNPALGKPKEVISLINLDAAVKGKTDLVKPVRPKTAIAMKPKDVIQKPVPVIPVVREAPTVVSRNVSIDAPSIPIEEPVVVTDTTPVVEQHVEVQTAETGDTVTNAAVKDRMSRISAFLAKIHEANDKGELLIPKKKEVLKKPSRNFIKENITQLKSTTEGVEDAIVVSEQSRGIPSITRTKTTAVEPVPSPPALLMNPDNQYPSLSFDDGPNHIPPPTNPSDRTPQQEERLRLLTELADIHYNRSLVYYQIILPLQRHIQITHILQRRADTLYKRLCKERIQNRQRGSVIALRQSTEEKRNLAVLHYKRTRLRRQLRYMASNVAERHEKELKVAELMNTYHKRVLFNIWHYSAARKEELKLTRLESLVPKIIEQGDQNTKKRVFAKFKLFLQLQQQERRDVAERSQNQQEVLQIKSELAEWQSKEQGHM